MAIVISRRPSRVTALTTLRILTAMAPFAFHNLFTRVFRAMQRPRSTWTHQPAQAKPQTRGFTRGHKPKSLARGHFLAILTALTLSYGIAKGDEIYTFDVFFDDRLIGEHQFVRSTSETGEEIVTSRASLALKIFFFSTLSNTSTPVAKYGEMAA